MQLSQNLGWHCQGHCTVKQQLYHKLHSHICTDTTKYIILSHNQLFTTLAFVLIDKCDSHVHSASFSISHNQNINLVTFHQLEIKFLDTLGFIQL